MEALFITVPKEAAQSTPPTIPVPKTTRRERIENIRTPTICSCHFNKFFFIIKHLEKHLKFSKII